MDIFVAGLAVSTQGCETFIKLTTAEGEELSIRLDLPQAMVLESCLAATNFEVTLADIRERSAK